MAKSKNKPILVFSSSSDSLRKITCNCCEKNLVVASVDKFCPICFSEFKTDSVPVKLSASSSTLEPRLTCEECGTDIYSNSLKDNKALASSMFCPKCGSAKVKASFDEEVDEEFNENEYDDIEASGEYDDIEEDLEYEDVDEVNASAKTRKSRLKSSNEYDDIEEDLEYEDVEASTDEDEDFDESEYKDLEKLSGSIDNLDESEYEDEDVDEIMASVRNRRNKKSRLPLSAKMTESEVWEDYLKDAVEAEDLKLGGFYTIGEISPFDKKHAKTSFEKDFKTDAFTVLELEGDEITFLPYKTRVPRTKNISYFSNGIFFLDEEKSRLSANNEYDDIEEDLEYEDVEASAKKSRIKASTCEDGSECEDEIEEDYSDIDPESLEASFINLPEPTWMFFSKGNPVIKLKRSRVNADSHLIFATAKFPELFINRIKETCVATALKDFNAEVFNASSLMNSIDLENMAFEKLQSTVLPKFQDCVALTVEGAAKGVYPDLNQELKASFFDAFISRGIPESQVKDVIEASFLDAGPVVFSAIIAKATELMYKTDEAYSEIKATIHASGAIRQVVEEDLETKEFKTRIKAGNLPFTNNDFSTAALNSNIAQTSLDAYRSRIKFKK